MCSRFYKAVAAMDERSEREMELNTKGRIEARHKWIENKERPGLVAPIQPDTVNRK